MLLGSLLTLPAAALRTTARVLRALADTGEVLAAVLKPSDGDTADAQPATPADVAPQGPAAAATARTPEADVATIASWTAPRVVAALDDLSTAALTDLYEYESRHRRRRTVLQAIEHATLPPPAARDTHVPPAEVRLPDELVYTSQTPARR